MQPSLDLLWDVCSVDQPPNLLSIISTSFTVWVLSAKPTDPVPVTNWEVFVVVACSVVLLESEHLHSFKGLEGKGDGNFPKHPNLQQCIQMTLLAPGPEVYCQLPVRNPLLSPQDQILLSST